MKTEVPPEVVAPYAREFADWRLGGCPGYGFAEAFKARLKVAARSAGVPYWLLWGEVHRAAYVLIDAATPGPVTVPASRP
jgi:hypothetical protein